MKFDWPSDAKGRLRRDIMVAAHDGHASPLFSDAGLAALLDTYPRDRLGLYSFPPHAEGRVEALHGEAPEMSGADILQAVKTGAIWLNLRKVNEILPEYETLAGEIFGQLDASTGERTLKRDVGVLISSPNIHVHYHLDIPMVCLVQLRGVKTLHLYPPVAPFAPPEQVEAVALREREEDIEFRDSFEADVASFELKPGMAITWPQNAPHRVQNADCMNVSLSCEFMTAPALIRANAIYANGVLRRRYHRNPAPLGAVGPGMIARAGLARAFKIAARPVEKGPTPVTFRLHPETLTVEPIVPRARAAALRYELKDAGELTQAEIAGWQALCETVPHGRSPLLSPHFARMVARARSDVKCALAWRGSELVAAMGVHARPLGLSRPVGAPFDDCAGPLIAPGCGVTVETLVRASGLHAYRAHASIQPGADTGIAPKSAYLIALKGRSPEAYLEARRAEHPKRLKNFRRLGRKLAAEWGEVDISWGAPDAASLALLLDWKSRQLQQSGLVDFTRATLSRAVLDAAAQTPFGPATGFGGFATLLHLNGAVVAGHFGVRAGDYFHPWLSAFDPDLAEYGPGVQLLYRVVETMAEMGLETYDLAEGHGEYKKYFAETGRACHEVSVAAATLPGRLQSAASGGWAIIGATQESSAAARLKRRLDHIAACEAGIAQRTQEVVTALRKRRHLGGDTGPELEPG